MVKIKIQCELGLTLVFAIATKLLLILQTFAGPMRTAPDFWWWYYCNYRS